MSLSGGNEVDGGHTMVEDQGRARIAMFLALLALPLPFSMPRSRTPLGPDARPPLQRLKVERFTVVATGHDQQGRGTEFVADMVRATRTRNQPRFPRLQQDVVTTSGHLA
jgi:hypothetical protein